jgi:hypothetical protein
MNVRRALGILFSVSMVMLEVSGCKPSARSKKPAAGLPALTAPSWRIPLEAPGFPSAELAVPLAATRARPVLIALHGDADRPEWQCGSYRGVVKPQSFILCPRGNARADGRFTLGSPEQTAAELRALLRQLKTRFGAHVARGDVVLAALGPAVEQALRLAVEEPKFFSRLILVDGSTRALTSALATRFGQLGGQRVLALCTPGACDADIDVRVRALQPPGVATRVIHLQHGQGLDQISTARLREEWSWLISGDPRWQ